MNNGRILLLICARLLGLQSRMLDGRRTDRRDLCRRPQQLVRSKSVVAHEMSIYAGFFIAVAIACFNQGCHDGIPFSGFQMNSIIAQFLPQITTVIDHRGIVVQVDILLPSRKGFHPLIEGLDVFRRAVLTMHDWFAIFEAVIMSRREYG